jgi:hypothetical protein
MDRLTFVVLKSCLTVTCVTNVIAVSLHATPQVDAKAALSVEIIEGQNAINNITRNTAYEPVIEIRDAGGRPVPGANVTFTLPAVGPSGVFTDGSKTLMIQTDASGRATARGLRPNNQVGQFDIRVTASFQGQSASVNITQTNAAPAVSTTKSGKKLAIILGIVGGGAAAVAVAAAGGGGSGGTSARPSSPPSSDPVGGSVTPGAPGFGPPR